MLGVLPVYIDTEKRPTAKQPRFRSFKYSTDDDITYTKDKLIETPTIDKHVNKNFSNYSFHFDSSLFDNCQKNSCHFLTDDK